MKISNKNIRNLIRWSIIAVGIIALADLILAQTGGYWGEFFKGYSAFIIPAIIFGTYAYIGMPIFQFNAESEVLHIKSHLAFWEVLGKELYVAKKNILKFEIDRKRLRKKLTIHYLKDGKEFSQTFSITLLSSRKIEKLARELELIHSEVRGSGNYHLFI